VVDVTSCLLPVTPDSTTIRFEPGPIAHALPQSILDLDCTIVVLLKDSKRSVEYEFQKFISKDYRTDGVIVHFGGSRLVLAELSIFIGLKFILEDLSSITDQVMG
jgi:hypothetical protein